MPKTDEVLSQLAQKLGVSVEHLWAALLAQQKIEGVLLCVVSGVLLLLILALVGAFFVSDDLEVTGWSACGAVSLSLALCPIAYWAFTDLLNPAYAAFYDIAHFAR